MSQKQNVRSSSHGRKVLPALAAHARPSKPPLLHRRGYSYNHTYPRLGHGTSKRASTEIVYQDEEVEEGGMASFLQFCTTCEKQIVTPGSSILYCSESCRRKDVSRGQPIQTVLSPSGVISPAAGYFDMPPTDIVTPLSPTSARPTSLTFSDFTASGPDSPSDEFEEHRGRHGSEAARYLPRYYSRTFTTDQASARRPYMNRASTGTESGLPSLSHTPSSSVGTAASMSSCRPLPPRHDPSGGHFPAKSIDLVTPSYPSSGPSRSAQPTSANTVTSPHTEAADVSFDRRKPTQNPSHQSSGSLKQLFSHEAMQARPKDT